MFEKEAEEYVNTHVAPLFSISEQDLYDCFQMAATFGYNKAKEELEEKYKETFANLEMNLNSVTERLEELNKAGECMNCVNKYRVAIKCENSASWHNSINTTTKWCYEVYDCSVCKWNVIAVNCGGTNEAN